MIKIELLKNVRLYAKRNSGMKAKAYFEEGLVSKTEYGVYKDHFIIRGEVISQDLFNLYNTEIDINLSDNAFSEFKCTCKDFDREVNELGRSLYACKHVVATAYNAINMLIEEQGRQNIISKSQFILEKLESKSHDKVKIDLELSRVVKSYNSFIAEFRIGEKKKYSLKSVLQFIDAYKHGERLEFGKEFIFDPNRQYFSDRDKKVIDFIIGMLDIEGFYIDRRFSRSSEIIKGKSVRIPNSRIGEFLLLYCNEKINFEYNNLIHNRIEIVQEDLPLAFSVVDMGEDIEVLPEKSMPVELSNYGQLYLYDYKLYIPKENRIEQYKLINEAFAKDKSLLFKASSLETVVTKLVPILKQVTDEVAIDSVIQERIINEKLKVKFYLDRDRGIILKVKFFYNNYEVGTEEFTANNMLILRDLEKEAYINSEIYDLGFVKDDNKFFLRGEGEFEFLSKGIDKLLKLGEVFYSDRFKNHKIHKMDSIKANIQKTERGYLDFTFSIADISEAEIKNILRAFKDNRKYYKLKNEDFIDLADKEVAEFLTLIENLSMSSKISNNTIEVPNNKAFYLESYIDDNEMDFIDGRQDIKDITSKVKDLHQMDFGVPQNLNAELREYQVTGFKWFKTLAYLGFGGILGDEMGLGKTVQTIAFILSEGFKNSLIVVPTSLIYNWKNEFEKFAPSLKVGIVAANKEEREETLNNKDKYEVIITTYNLLRRDIDTYKELNFDLMIIDEAQNIKNPGSQAAKAAKLIDAKLKFALTGTPIENSLVELWSIFDFVMPGYLYSKGVFTETFEKKSHDENSLKELNRHIKPFILRRYKKDVILELPDKIETKLVVEMTEKQKRVYSAYVKDVKEKIEENISEKSLEKNKIEIFSYLTKLRELCLDPSVVVDGYKGGSGKIDALADLLDTNLNEGHRILVFSQFTRVLKNISKTLEKNKISYCYLDGSIKSEKRIELVNEFNEGKYSVFLISLKAGGTGLNLTSADMVIHFDPWWNPAVEDQATDRAHRYGQKNVVEVIKMVAKGSIEEKILKLQEDKKQLITKVLGDELEAADSFLKLSQEDIVKLFEINL